MKFDNIEEFEKHQTKVNKLHNLIGNIQLLLNEIGNSDVCPFCRNKVDLSALKEEYNEHKKEVNKLDTNIQYRNVV